MLRKGCGTASPGRSRLACGDGQVVHHLGLTPPKTGTSAAHNLQVIRNRVGNMNIQVLTGLTVYLL